MIFKLLLKNLDLFFKVILFLFDLPLILVVSRLIISMLLNLNLQLFKPFFECFNLFFQFYINFLVFFPFSSFLISHIYQLLFLQLVCLFCLHVLLLLFSFSFCYWLPKCFHPCSFLKNLVVIIAWLPWIHRKTFYLLCN